MLPHDANLFGNLNEQFCNAAKADTIFPLPYFPAYPGSWWEYQQTSIQCDNTLLIYPLTVTTSNDYMLEKNHGWPGANSECVFVPYYGEQPVFGYQMWSDMDGMANDNYEFVTILSEKKGLLYVGESDWNDWKYCSYTEVVDTSIVINTTRYDSVIVVGQHYNCGDTILGKSFYAKNIGLILRESYRADGTWRAKMELVNHFINH